jgi:DNA-binding transcriptional MerR regulator/methylmalonyl-CoA mutase cobalamin-binding subunit
LDAPGYPVGMSEGMLRIGELSRRTGVSTDAIRAWERRYDLLRPARTAGNFRLYSAGDISRLRLMRHYLGNGVPAAQAAALVHRVQSAAVVANPGIPRGDVRSALSVLRAGLESFDDGPPGRVLERLLGVFTAGAVLRDVVLPYLRSLGDRWACGEATIAQEHFASAFIESWMLGMARRWSRSGARKAVLACVPGERHTLGLLAAGLALHDLDWRITYLGPDTPVHAVAQVAAATEPDAIVLSCTLPSHWAGVRADVRRLLGVHPVMLGGAAVAGDRSHWTASRCLPVDPIVAAQALTANQDRRPSRAAKIPAGLPGL